MDLARTYRTARHLSLSQLINRPICRGKFAAMERFPGLARRHFTRVATSVGDFDFARPSLAAATSHIVELQRAVHGGFLDGIAEGRFTLLNRTIDFDGLNGVEWRRELGERNNRLWRMNLSYMGYLVALADRDGASAVSAIRSLLTSLTKQNPWNSRGVFRDVWHPYSVSHRVINLVTCMSVLARQGVEVDIHTSSMIEDEIRLGTAFLLSNLERDLQYNHLLKNYVCLAVVASALEARNNFAERPLSGVSASVRQQFLADGGHAERAPMYHMLSLIDLRVLRDSGALAPHTQLLVEQQCVASEQAVAAMVHPDGEVALFNDSWLGEAPKASELVTEVPLAPELQSRWVLPQMGYVRLAYGDDSVIMDFGPCGPDNNPGHAHGDFLSLELSVGGERLLVDTGVPTYSEGDLRDRSRSSAAHNGPIRRGLEPIEFWGSFRVGRRGYAHVLPVHDTMSFAAWHDGYLDHRVAVARAIRLLPGRGLLICDIWAGPSVELAEMHLLVAGSWRLEGLEARSGHKVVRFEAIEGSLSDEEATRHWLRFGEALDARRITLTPPSTDRLRSTCLWLCWDEGGTLPTDVAHDLSHALQTAFLSVDEVRKIAH
jgi:hypothetical protein